MVRARKELGQNFLFDDKVLATIAGYGELSSSDSVLEIGPGLGTLTRQLCARAGRVTAVEFDSDLAANLQDLASENSKLAVINEDILRFDLDSLPRDYKVVANIPYNITSKIIERLWASDNQPQLAVLLVQKEVAERLAARAGQLSVIAIATQVFATIELGIKVPAELFTPAPKVDSQVVIMKRRPQPLVPADKLDQFMYVVKAGFSEKRKKLRSSLAVGLRTNKVEAERLLAEVGIDPNKRAQELTIDEWKRLAKVD
ncbi:MAG: 16S rRNA (adenine(1518)-N(6)/adenine(1519)-N(6))-dimethyltransferase RsmA [Candidatus Saccharibacteria bacterium]|nr:16S rRNA (adenine(1518)-N(6)/adenine(1519)-N(6))-dimethyltransferase RsmA [Candidatus Saccharibacteria bacterium]